MNNDEAKFILSVYRPNGRDATDPLFAEPLAQAQHDPQLQAWFKSQLEFDFSVSAKLRELPPPAGLRELILAGARASRPPKPWWFRVSFLAAAAAALLFAAATLIPSGPAPLNPAEFTRFALHDTSSESSNHFGNFAPLRDLQERLAATNFKADPELNLDLARMRANGCRSIRLSGHDLFEICFGPDQECHLYFGRRSDFDIGSGTVPLQFTERGPLAAATWADSSLVYALVATGSSAALRAQF